MCPVQALKISVGSTVETGGQLGVKLQRPTLMSPDISSIVSLKCSSASSNMSLTV